MALLGCRRWLTSSLNFDLFLNRLQGVNLSEFCIFDTVGQVEKFGINSAVDGFLGAGWSLAARLKFDARQQRWRPNPTLHLMHSTNPPVGPLPPRAASPGLKISTGTRPDPVLPAEAGGAAQRGPCIV